MKKMVKMYVLDDTVYKTLVESDEKQNDIKILKQTL